MSLRQIIVLAALVGPCFFLAPVTATAASAVCTKCQGTGHCDQTATITVTEMRTVCETHYREEQQVRVKQVPKVIEVPTQVPYKYSAWVRVKKEDVQEFEVKTPKFRWVDQKYTITVRGVDTVTKTHTHTEQIPRTEIQMVKEDQGYYETQLCASKTCCGCLCTEKKVWCPCLVEVAKEVTVMDTVTIEEPYVCEVPICVPIEKTRKVKEYFTKTEKKTVKHPYTTLEHRQKTKMVTAFVPETVYEEQLETCTVKVPYTVERQIAVPVTRKVRKSTPCSCCDHGPNN